MQTMLLYHAGYREIREPDVRFGRKNADFGQGFYLTADESFACRWAKARRDADCILNAYALDLTGLLVRRFAPDEDWIGYILRNRAGRAELYPEADVILGPVANDTLFNTLGIISSGFLKPEEALSLLRVGPRYEQVVLKTKNAAAQLRWLHARVLTPDELRQYQALLEQEEAEYQTQFAAAMEKL